MKNPPRETTGAAQGASKSAKDLSLDAMGKAMEEMDYEKEEMHEHEGSAISTLLKAVNVAATGFAVLRYFDRYLDARSVLRWMGFARRRSFWGSAALFGAGAVAGAGIAMFVSPVSGRQTRQGMMRGFRTIGRKGRELIQSTGISQITEGMGQGEGEQGREGAKAGEQGGREGREGGREQGREGREGGMRAGGEQRGGEQQRGGISGGGGEANRPGMSGSESMAGAGANRGEAGKQLNR